MSERLQAIAERISAEAEMTPEERRRADEARARAQCERYNSTPGHLKDGYTISTIQSDSTFVDGDGYDCKLCMNRGDTLHLRETPTGFYQYSVPCKCMEIRKSIWRLKRSGLENINLLKKVLWFLYKLFYVYTHLPVGPDVLQEVQVNRFHGIHPGFLPLYHSLLKIHMPSLKFFSNIVNLVLPKAFCDNT